MKNLSKLAVKEFIDYLSVHDIDNDTIAAGLKECSEEVVRVFLDGYWDAEAVDFFIQQYGFKKEYECT